MLRWAQIAALATEAGAERDAHALRKEVRPKRGNFGHDRDTKAPVRTIASRLCLILIAAMVSGRAFAQAVFVHRATMRLDGVAVAQVSRTPATIMRWAGLRRPVLHFEDAALEVEISLDLHDDETRIVVTSTDEQRLANTQGWAIRMLPDGWAPLWGVDRAGHPRILLPAQLPVASASMVGTIVPFAQPPTPRAFAPQASGGQRGWESASQPFVLHPRAGGRAWRLEPGTSYRVMDSQRREVEVLVERFVVLGRASRLPVASSGTGNGPGQLGGRGCVQLVGPQEARRVPAGTELLPASARGAAPIGRTRVELVALAPNDCAQRPCVAGDATRWLLASPGAGDPRWLLNVWIRGPLDIMPPPTQGARYCWPVVAAWP